MLKGKSSYRAAIIGATGAIGRELIELLEERDFPLADLLLFASEHSAGERIEFRGGTKTVRQLAKGSLDGVDVAFYLEGEAPGTAFVTESARSGMVVIDCSAVYPREPMVPIIVPEVNAGSLEGHAGIIANPGCSSIGVAITLNPIHAAAQIKRIIVTTFQSVSGTGKKAMDELAGQTVALLNFRDVEKTVYPHQIAFNCLPQTSAFLDSGSTREEAQLAFETRKILNDDSILVTATAVRVPVFRGYAASINVETAGRLTPNEARAALSRSSGVTVYDDPARNVYPLQIDVAGTDEVRVGRIRADDTVPHGLNLWIAYDEVRKGAALNAVQIAEFLIQ